MVITQLYFVAPGVLQRTVMDKATSPSRLTPARNPPLLEMPDAVQDEFDISHVTVQFECESCDPSDNIICTQVAAR